MNKVEYLSAILKTKKLSSRKLRVFLSNWLSFIAKRESGGPLPSLLFLELVNYCQLSCPGCLAGAKNRGVAKLMMPFPLFTKIIDEVADSTLCVSLWNNGEPLLMREIAKYIDYANRKNIFTRLSTNANVHFSETQAVELLESGVDHILVSLDGYDQETYSRYRQGGNFDLAVSFLRQLCELKRKKGKPFPFIELQCLLVEPSEGFFAKMKELAHSIGVDKLQFSRFYSHPEQRKLGDHSGFVSEGKSAGLHKHCSRPWLSSIVLADGSVSVCPYDYGRRYELGSVAEQSLAEIWQGRGYRDFRVNGLSGDDNKSLCFGCTNRFLDKAIN